MDLQKATEEFFEVPAEALEKSIEFAQKEERILFSKQPFRLAQEYFNTLGPGLVTGAADDDPSGIATYSQTGAQYGLQLLWLSVLTFPLMAVVQEMCARIGVVTGHGLASNIRYRYSKTALYFVCLLLFCANALNIAADLGAMAAGTELLFPNFDFLLLVICFGLLSVLLQIFTTYARYAKILKWMTLALFSYVLTAFAVQLDWGTTLTHTFTPSLTFSKDQLFLLCAILGTTISPYLFFWQTSQEIEEQRENNGEEHLSERRAGAHDETMLSADIRKMRIDVWSGMFFSNLIMFFIIAACAATLYTHGITNIQTAAQAAEAIRPFGGTFTYFFFAVGIIGTGLLAIPVLAGSSAYALAESFGWKRGLHNKLTQAYAFYGVIIISMLIGILANVAHLDPIKMLLYSAVANGLVAPVVLFFIVRISSSMKRRPNHPFITAVGWLTTLLMGIAGVAAVVSIFS